MVIILQEFCDTKSVTESLASFIKSRYKTQAAFARAVDMNQGEVSRFLNYPELIGKLGCKRFYDKVNKKIGVNFEGENNRIVRNESLERILTHPRFQVDRPHVKGINAVFQPFPFQMK